MQVKLIIVYLVALMAIISEFDVWIHITFTITRFIYTIMNLTVRMVFHNRIDHWRVKKSANVKESGGTWPSLQRKWKEVPQGEEENNDRLCKEEREHASSNKDEDVSRKVKVGQTVAVAVDVQKQKKQQWVPRLRKCKTELPTLLQTNATIPVAKRNWKRVRLQYVPV